ncbi:MAG: NifU family protein [Candidatus Buchananbacteria bacterium]
MEEEIKKVLADVRPSLQADGGDVEYVGFDEKTGIVKVKLQGACSHCPMSTLTLKEGIGRVLKSKIVGVTDIEAV